MSIRDVLNNYNDEQNAKHGSSVEEALRETLFTLGTGIPKPTLMDAGHVLKVGLNGEWVIGTDNDQELPPVTSDDGGYSGHANKEDLKMDLRMMMENSKSDQERMAIQKVLDMWKE